MKTFCHMLTFGLCTSLACSSVSSESKPDQKTVIQEEEKMDIPLESTESAGSESSSDSETGTETSENNLQEEIFLREEIISSLEKILEKKPLSKFTSENVTVKVIREQTKDKWIFDRNRYEYYLREADKGAKYVSFDLNISSEDKNPLLPGFFACFPLEEEIELFCLEGDLKFYQWESYGTYLGNYHDSRNDFSKSETVKFTVGFHLPENLLVDHSIIFTAQPSCLLRQEDRWEDPAVFYTSHCEAPTLLDLENLPIFKIENKKLTKAVLQGYIEALSSMNEGGPESSEETE